MNQLELLKSGIKHWAEEDRPREKLQLKGKKALSDSELIGILIGSGTTDLTAVDLAKQILADSNNDLNLLAKKSVADLMKFKGIGEAKAINIVSALELGRRRKEVGFPEASQIRESSDVFNYMHQHLKDLSHEEFWVLLLNRANRIIKAKSVSTGGISGTVADPKIIFKIALDHTASGIILVHNHPSGNLKPSEADKKLTKKIAASGSFLDIPVLDHIIYTDYGFFSFADESLL